MAYGGKNMNACSNNEESNEQVAPNPRTNDEIINANSDQVIPDTPINVVNNKTI